jgi:hypothetical protein
VQASLLVDDAAVAASVTVYTLPAIVTVPVRDAVPVFAATLSDTVPLPLPEEPEATVIHATLLSADHPHEVPAVTPTVNVPPPEPADWLAGEMLKVQPAEAWVTVKGCPPAVILPVRVVAPLFAWTLYVTHPLPLPDPPDRIFNHDESLDDDQVHPAGAVIATLDAPPAAVTDVDERPSV